MMLWRTSIRLDRKWMHVKFRRWKWENWTNQIKMNKYMREEPNGKWVQVKIMKIQKNRMNVCVCPFVLIKLMNTVNFQQNSW